MVERDEKEFTDLMALVRQLLGELDPYACIHRPGSWEYSHFNSFGESARKALYELWKHVHERMEPWDENLTAEWEENEYGGLTRTSIHDMDRRLEQIREDQNQKG